MCGFLCALVGIEKASGLNNSLLGEGSGVVWDSSVLSKLNWFSLNMMEFVSKRDDAKVGNPHLQYKQDTSERLANTSYTLSFMDIELAWCNTLHLLQLAAFHPRLPGFHKFHKDTKLIYLALNYLLFVNLDLDYLLFGHCAWVGLIWSYMEGTFVILVWSKLLVQTVLFKAWQTMSVLCRGLKSLTFSWLMTWFIHKVVYNSKTRRHNIQTAVVVV